MFIMLLFVCAIVYSDGSSFRVRTIKDLLYDNASSKQDTNKTSFKEASESQTAKHSHSQQADVADQNQSSQQTDDNVLKDRSPDVKPDDTPEEHHQSTGEADALAELEKQRLAELDKATREKQEALQSVIDREKALEEKMAQVQTAENAMRAQAQQNAPQQSIEQEQNNTDEDENHEVSYSDFCDMVYYADVNPNDQYKVVFDQNNVWHEINDKINAINLADKKSIIHKTIANMVTDLLNKPQMPASEVNAFMQEANDIFASTYRFTSHWLLGRKLVHLKLFTTIDLKKQTVNISIRNDRIDLYLVIFLGFVVCGIVGGVTIYSFISKPNTYKTSS